MGGKNVRRREVVKKAQEKKFRLSEEVKRGKKRKIEGKKGKKI